MRARAGRLRALLRGLGETGAACALWRDGRLVADLWAGEVRPGRPWRQDTLVGVYSTAKPFAALGLLVLVDRGLVELDAPVVRYWLRYGDRGKAATTVRHVFTHRAGLMATDPPIPAAELFDWNRVCEALAASPPQWEPGTDQGEHAVFYGHLVGEIARRVTGVPFGAWLRREIAAPWGLELHSGLTPDEMSRCATLVGPPDPGVANGPGWRGGSLGWADPRAGIAFAYVTAGMRTHERAMAVWEAARRT